MKQFNMDDSGRSSQHAGMTHYVNLPTGGKYYPEGHPLRGALAVEVKMLTTKEEDILTNVSYIEQNVIIDKLIEEIVLHNIKAKDLYETDQMAILVAARIEAYGGDYPIELLCEHCAESVQHDFDLTNVAVKEAGDQAEETEANTFIVELPKSKKTIEFKHLLPSEVASIRKTIDKMKKLNINTSFTVEFYKRAVVSIDGQTDNSEISNFVEQLRIMDSRKLLSAYQNSLPSLDTTYKAVCHSCGHTNEGGLPIQANFFFPKF
jgi:hypothetical protein